MLHTPPPDEDDVGIPHTSVSSRLCLRWIAPSRGGAGAETPVLDLDGVANPKIAEIARADVLDKSSAIVAKAARQPTSHRPKLASGVSIL